MVKQSGLIVNKGGVIGPAELLVVSDVIRGFVLRRWDKLGLGAVARPGELANHCAEDVLDVIRERMPDGLTLAGARELYSMVLLSLAAAELALLSDVNSLAEKRSAPCRPNAK